MFKFFSPTAPRPPTELTRTSLDALQIEDEKAKLTTSLHTLLESLSQSYDGEANVTRLCETIIETTSHLRFVWLGFCEEGAETVEPYAAVGDCASESDEWNLPKSCFEYTGPYAQASQESVGELNELNSLFAPWQKNIEACSANSALAIPLRSGKGELRGLLVFYAEDVDYFSHMGIAPFQALGYVAELIWQQSNLMQMLAQKTQLDTLTGLMNRRKTMHVLGRAIEQADESGEALTVMICRIKEFDKLNEQHGWLSADAILAAFAKEITSRLRTQDSVGRWTSIEFMFILPRTDVKQAEFLSQSLQAYVMSHPIIADHENTVRLNLSVSVTAYDRESNGLEDMIQQANSNIQRVIQSEDTHA